MHVSKRCNSKRNFIDSKPKTLSLKRTLSSRYSSHSFIKLKIIILNGFYVQNKIIRQLEEKIFSLESKVQQLEKTASKNVNQLTGKSTIPRTCREAHLADPSLASGMHWIDPDGQGVGDDPIFVYCNMTTGRRHKRKYVSKNKFSNWLFF